MLSNGEQAAFLESIKRVQRQVFNGLRADRGVATPVNFVATLHRAIDKTVRQAKPRPECQAGCAHCCSVRVEATEPEIFLIVGEIRKRPTAEIDALHERLRIRQAAAPSDRAECVFLKNNLCSIYAVRPAVCRRAHSLSLARCAGRAPEIPQNLELALATEALMRGTWEGYHRAGLRVSAHELCGAVLEVLADETTEASWRNGESASRRKIP